jgi:hypothetical protein
VADLLSPRLRGWVDALFLPGGGALREALVRRSWVVLAAVPSLNGEARLQELRRQLVDGAVLM